ncbi:hypothetical protein LJC16_00360 [Bacteroidales bacterium OttesenSCG-928-C19]|nr:hypothetical protein [Bacteroidales bacterium OttesenSCG-928-C19]
MIQTLKIAFHHHYRKVNSKGEAPIYCKITLGEERQQFSTSIYLKEDIWDKASQRAFGVTDEAQLINRKLQEIYSQLIKIEKQLYDEGAEVSLNAIYNRYKGKEFERPWVLYSMNGLLRWRNWLINQLSVSKNKRI